MEKQVYQELATAYNAFGNCVQSNNDFWREHWAEKVNQICEDILPRGSGFDSGTSFDWERSKDNRLVLSTSYHHMNENGFYCGWSDHDIIVTPDLIHGFVLRVTGRNVRDIKDYIYDVFQDALSGDMPA